MLVIAVGTDSEWGRTMALVSGESEATPLQDKLTDLAGAIARVGLAVAVLAFVVLMIRCGALPQPAPRITRCCMCRFWTCARSSGC